jgi:hypothetical protein
VPNKDRELRYVEALRRALSDFPTGDLVPAETPDALVQSSSSTIGIEVTVFHLVEGDGSKRPHQEQQALKDRIVERAWSRHVQDGGPALYVAVHFNRSPLDKATVASVADAIVAAIARLGKEPSADDELTVPWRDLPPEVAFISVHRSINGQDQLWHADAGGWVAEASWTDVQRVVTQKARMELKARQKCSELWLVIVNDQFSRAAQAELGPEAAIAQYAHSFDRLIWLVPHIPKAVVLSSKSERPGR